ncbi:hypothetical protein V6N13_142903 [Hibiscus sabdariffa]
MELLWLVVKIILAAALLGFTAMFFRLFDALVSTPNRIRSQFPIQASSHNAPPSSLPANNTNFKGKQVQRICFHRGEYRYCRGSIWIWPKMVTSDEGL